MNSKSHLDTPCGTKTTLPDILPRVVIDFEKLRHINCGLGRFSLYLAQELLARSDNCFEPVFFIPDGCDHYFEATLVSSSLQYILACHMELVPLPYIRHRNLGIQGIE